MPTLVMISNKKPEQGLTKVETWVRGIFVAGYVAFTLAMFAGFEFSVGGTTFSVPRLFWTIGLPLLPIGIVIAGYYPWRKVCPLAYFGSLGRKLDTALAKREKSPRPSGADKKGKGEKKAARRVPAWAEAWYPMIALTLLAIALVGRLLLTNGDGIALGILLVALGLGAALVNWRFTGKTWCNFVCPVSIVERIYTEPNSLRLEHNSQCEKCTACKKNCPDIDQENSYWKDIGERAKQDVGERAKRMAYFSFPGLVLAFYTYFWLRTGDWEAYFGGGWTRQPVTAELLTGPGLFFAPWLPAYAAAPLSVATFMLGSYGVFWAIDKLVARWWTDDELRTHRMFTLAGFVAFNLFYVFAGAPTLRKIPYGPRVLAFVVPLLSTMFLVKRWKRSRKDFMEERSAKSLLRKWKFRDPPPDDPAGVFAYFKAQAAAEEQQLLVYRESVRQVYGDGIATKHELQLLELLRGQLNVSEGEHRKIMEELRADSSKVVSEEEELQLQGYRQALTNAMLRNADELELRKLRREYAIDRATHERIAAELRSDRSPMLERVRESLARIAELREQLLIPLAPLRASGTFDFALFVIERMQQRALTRVLEALPLTVPKARSEELRKAASALTHSDPEEREQALAQLQALVDGAIFQPIAAVIRDPRPQGSASAPDQAAFERAIERMLADPDPYLRTGAIQAVGHLRLDKLRTAMIAARSDEEPLVRETLVYASLRAPGLLTTAELEPLLEDDDPQIRRAAREALEALATPEQIPEANPIRVVEGRTLPPIPDDAFSVLATADKLMFLRCVPLFEQLEPEDLHELCRIARERTIPSTGAICVQGQATDDLYVLISGTAAVTVATARTSLVLRPGEVADPNEIRGEREVALLGPGDVVGELAAIDQSPRSASVRPKDGPVRLLEIRGEDFRKRVVQRKDVAPKLMATLARRLRETLAKVR
jgi:CRP-like cAMP-binding protein